MREPTLLTVFHPDYLEAGALQLVRHPTTNVLWDGDVVPGFKKPTRNAGDTAAIAEYNERLNGHPELMTATVPLRDGVAISVKRGSSELQPLLHTLARATQALREADFNDDARK